MTKHWGWLFWLGLAVAALLALPQLSALDTDMRITGLFLLGTFGLGYVSTSQSKRIDALRHEVTTLRADLQRTLGPEFSQGTLPEETKDPTRQLE
jgi:hypothetical protein